MVYFLYNPGDDVPLRFEFDPAKSSANKAKHGIDFVEAQELWLDRRVLTAPSRFPGEERYEAIGRIGDRIWMAAVTMRDTRVRVISVRRARREEVAAYEEGRTHNG